MKYKVYIMFFLCSFDVLAQQIVPSNNRSIAGLEKNMLFNAKSRFTVTQMGTATLDLPTLFDGKMTPSYTNTAPSVSNPTVVVIENLLNLHVQAGAWVGWTTRYWAPKTFKIEGYNAYDNANTWVTIADVINYTNFDYIQAVPSGSFTKLRFTFYEGAGTNGLLGISELFFLHPEAVAAYDGLSVQYNPNGNVGIGTITPTSPLHIIGNTTLQGSSATNYVPSILFKRTEGANMYSIGPKNATITNSTFDINSINGNPITFSTENVEKVTILNNGNVGIGTTSPTQKLEIGGGRPITFNSSLGIIKMKGDPGGWAMNYGFTGSNDTDWGGFWGYGGADNLVQWSIGKLYTDNFFVVKSTGNVGIGTNAPITKFTVAGAFTPAYMQIAVKNNTEGEGIGVSLNETSNIRRGHIYAQNGNGLILGDETGYGLRMFSGGSEILTARNNGNVGIGTTNPQSKLQVTGDNSIISITPNQEGQNRAINFMASTTVNAKYASIELNSTSGNLQFRSGSAGSGLGFSTSFFTDNIERMRINHTGQVLIGTTTPYLDYKLAVAGNVIADKVKVKKSTNGTWPDFVFLPTYKLPTLTEVESFVKQNSHLPEIPSAAEIEKDGQDLGEMNRLLLKKVEELTLYIISQEKRIEKLEKKSSNRR